VPMKLARTFCGRGCASFSVFYYLFSIAIWLTLACLVLVGELMEHGEVVGLVSIPAARVVLSVVSGFMWQVGNLLLAITLQIAGPGFAMCCCGSISMTLGTGLTYWISPKGSVPWLLGGVALAFFAAGATFQMHRLKNRALKKHSREMAVDGAAFEMGIASPDSIGGHLAPRRKAGLRLTFLLGAGSGLGIALFYPLNTLALKSPGSAVDVNAAMFWFGPGVFLGCQLCLPLLRKLLPQQFEDETPGMSPDPALLTCETCDASLWTKLFQETSRTSVGAICFSMLSGVIWAVGFFSNLRCGSADGFALAFGLSQTCPLMAIFWGLVIFHEFSGAWVPTSAKLLLVVDMLLYVGAVGCFVTSKLE